MTTHTGDAYLIAFRNSSGAFHILNHYNKGGLCPTSLHEAERVAMESALANPGVDYFILCVARQYVGKVPPPQPRIEVEVKWVSLQSLS